MGQIITLEARRDSHLDPGEPIAVRRRTFLSWTGTGDRRLIAR